MPTAARSTSLRPHRRDGTVTGRRYPGRPLVGLLLAACLAVTPLTAASAAVVDPSQEPVATPSASLEPTTPPVAPPPAPEPTTPPVAPAPVPTEGDGAAAPVPVEDDAAAHPLLEELAAATVPVPGVPFLGAPEAGSRFQAQVTCDPTEKPGAVRLRALLRSTYGRGTTAGISRACSVGGTSHHKEGRAYDWGLNAYDPADAALADAFLTWLVGPDRDGHVAGNARRLGVQYVIWDREIWYASSGLWKPYNGASPHTDHIHFSLSWDGAYARTSFWTGTAVTQVDHGPCQVYVGVLVAPYSTPNYTRCPPATTQPVGPVADGSPFGSFDSASSAAPESITVSGWLLDPDTEVSEVHVYVAGAGKAVTTTLARPDVAAVYPAFAGSTPGWSTRMSVPPGTHEVCVYGINSGAGSTVGLGCKTVTVRSGSPFGSFDSVSAAAGKVTVSGWLVDPDVEVSEVHVYVGGVGKAISTTLARPDVIAAYPASAGSTPGWSTSMSAPPGTHQVCVYGINSGAGSTVGLGCRTVTVYTGSPFGSFDSATAAAGTVKVSGWVVDPDVLSGEVHVYVGGVGVAIPAAATRADVSAAYPAFREHSHGWSAMVQVPPGAHQACAYAINSGGGTTVGLGCRTVTVYSGSPFGSFDSATAAAGTVKVSGWVVDPDVLSGEVHVYVGGVGVAVPASVKRADVSAAFPAFREHSQGWSASVKALPGTHQVCAYGINSGPGSTVGMGCRTVTVHSGSPIGSFDDARPRVGGVDVSGWVVDPDVLSSPVHVSVDGVVTALASTTRRADVAAAFPAYASYQHGWSGRVAASPGTRKVCVSGINSGPGGTLAMGCRTVTVPAG